MATLPSVPSIPAGIDPQTWQILNAIKTNVDYLQKLPALIESNQAEIEETVANVISTVNNSIANIDLSTIQDDTPPIALDNLQVTGGVLYNFLEWGELPGNADHVNIYRAAVNDRTQATIVGSSQVRIAADYIPEGVDTTYYYWLRAVSSAGIEGEWNLVNGSVSAQGTAASPLGIGDSQVSTISATKIVALSLSAISANLGTVTSGQIVSPDGTFIIDLSDKSITISGPNGVATDDYTILKNGQVQFWKWTGTTHQQGSSLQTIETGTANNGATVTLSKWYSAIPAIVVTPNDTPIYNKDYTNQSQKLQIRAENISRTAGGTVSFSAISRLVLSGSNPVFVVNDSYSGSSNSDTTATRTTSANTTKIDCSISFSSNRGTGTSPDYYYRKVDARIVYRVSPSGSWNYTSWITTNLGANFNTYTASLTTGTIASNTYDFYVEFLAADSGGTFSSGTIQYDYLQDDVYLGSNSALVDVYSYSDSGGTIHNSSPVTIAITMPSFTPASGYTVYQVDWTISYGYYVYEHLTFASAKVYNNINSSILQYGNGGTYNVPSATDTFTYTKTSYNVNQSPIECDATVGVTPNSEARSQSKVFAAGTFARIKTRKPQDNSTTPANVFTLISYSLTLSSATVIDSTGTLNWMSIA